MCCSKRFGIIVPIKSYETVKRSAGETTPRQCKPLTSANESSPNSRWPCKIWPAVTMLRAELCCLNTRTERFLKVCLVIFYNYRPYVIYPSTCSWTSAKFAVERYKIRKYYYEPFPGIPSALLRSLLAMATDGWDGWLRRWLIYLVRINIMVAKYDRVVRNVMDRGW